MNNQSGQLLHSKYFNQEQKLSKTDQYDNLVFDKQDPLKIASQFFALMKMTDIMAEEYKQEYPDAFNNDPAAQSAFASGFTSYRSDSVDYVLEHMQTTTLILFYSSSEVDDSVAQNLAAKLLEVLVSKNEKRFKSQQGMLS